MKKVTLLVFLGLIATSGVGAYAFSDGMFDEIIEDLEETELIKPTDDEINTKYNEWITSKYPMKLLRDERDRLIAESDWRVIKAKETSTNIPTAWKTYRQALRDLPSTQTPVLDSNSPVGISSVTWPTPPS